jgi:predicted  nucleic acid-binding Zn-ribbon protein
MCKEVGRNDLAEQIMEGWNKAFEKYAVEILKYRDQEGRAWAAASKIGSASVKKNVFGYKEFADWLKAETEAKSEEKLPPSVVSEAKKIDVLEAPKGVPAIAIPKDNETIEDWAEQAEKTKNYLEEIKKSLDDNDKFIGLLEKEIVEIRRKITDYGPNGSKSVTKDGKPHKFSLRVKKWEAELGVYETKLSETKASLATIKTKVTAAETNYRSSPACTVEYEKEAHDALEGVLEVLLNMKDLNKQKEMLGKFNDMLKKMQNENKVASMERSAGFWDKITEACDSVVSFFSSAWKSLTGWVKSLFNAVDKFDHIATDVGRY